MQNELTALSVLSLLDTTKAQRKTFAEQVLDQIEAGQVNPLLVHCQIKATENLIKQFTDKKEGGPINERYMAAVVAEAEKNGKAFEYHSGKFSIKEAGHKYDWSQCGDTELLALLEQQAELDALIKERQEFLKKVPGKGLTQVNTDTGETYTVYPPAVTSTTTVSVTLR